jgi:hypothetical protein
VLIFVLIVVLIFVNRDRCPLARCLLQPRVS